MQSGTVGCRLCGVLAGWLTQRQDAKAVGALERGPETEERRKEVWGDSEIRGARSAFQGAGP